MSYFWWLCGLFCYISVVPPFGSLFIAKLLAENGHADFSMVGYVVWFALNGAVVYYFNKARKLAQTQYDDHLSQGRVQAAQNRIIETFCASRLRSASTAPWSCPARSLT